MLHEPALISSGDLAPWANQSANCVDSNSAICPQSRPWIARLAHPRSAVAIACSSACAPADCHGCYHVKQSALDVSIPGVTQWSS